MSDTLATIDWISRWIRSQCTMNLQCNLMNISIHDFLHFLYNSTKIKTKISTSISPVRKLSSNIDIDFFSLTITYVEDRIARPSSVIRMEWIDNKQFEIENFRSYAELIDVQFRDNMFLLANKYCWHSWPVIRWSVLATNRKSDL